jgi:hypothetical protein
VTGLLVIILVALFVLMVTYVFITGFRMGARWERFCREEEEAIAGRYTVGTLEDGSHALLPRDSPGGR